MSRLELLAISGLLGSRQFTVLEIGAGTGRILRGLWSTDTRMVGVDVNKKMVKRSKERLDSQIGSVLLTPDFVVADGEHLPFRGEIFDVAICIRVLKYFRHPRAALKEMCSVINPKGRLILEFPNILGLSVLVQLHQRVFRGAFYPHLFSRRDIQKSLRESGMEVKQTIALHKIPPGVWNLADSRTMARVVFHLDVALGRITPREFMSRSLFVSALKLGSMLSSVLPAKEISLTSENLTDRIRLSSSRRPAGEID